jgi:hypothetical protein
LTAASAFACNGCSSAETAAADLAWHGRSSAKTAAANLAHHGHYSAETAAADLARRAHRSTMVSSPSLPLLILLQRNMLQYINQLHCHNLLENRCQKTWSAWATLNSATLKIRDRKFSNNEDNI